MSEYISSKIIQRSRTVHRCCDCHNEIPRGSQYEKYTGKFDGEISTLKTCPSCVELRDFILKDYVGHPDDFKGSQDFSEGFSLGLSAWDSDWKFVKGRNCAIANELPVKRGSQGRWVLDKQAVLLGV